MHEFEVRASTKSFPALHLPGVIFGDRGADLIVAKSFDLVPRFTDAFPRVGRSPYAHFALPFPQTYIDERQLAEILPDKPDINHGNIVKIVIPIISFGKDADPRSVAKQIDRGMQRVEQFKRLIGYIRDWEAQRRRGAAPLYSYSYESEGQIHQICDQITPAYLKSLKGIASSFFAGELSQEPFTNELSIPILPKQISDEEAAIIEADRLIAEQRFRNADRVEVSRQEINCQTNTKKPENPEVKPKTEKPPEKESIIAHEQNIQKVEQVSEQDSLIFENILAEVVQIISYDRPSKSAALYFREVWERPF